MISSLRFVAGGNMRNFVRCSGISSPTPSPTPLSFRSLSSFPPSFSPSFSPSFRSSLTSPLSSSSPLSPSSLLPQTRLIHTSPLCHQQQHEHQQQEEFMRKRKEHKEQQDKEKKEKIRKTGMKMTMLGLVFLGLAYVSVPLYRVFCASTGYGGSPIIDKKQKRVKDLQQNTDENGREVRVYFQAQVSDTLPWSFRPCQNYVNVTPGKSVLAFFNATNNSDNKIIGVATYNVEPPTAAKYFIKVQCFCFDEQRLLPHESVDMPVLFYIDPAYLEDGRMDYVDHLVLAYSFFNVYEYDEEYDPDEDDEDEDEEEEEKEEKEEKKEEVKGEQEEK